MADVIDVSSFQEPTNVKQGDFALMIRLFNWRRVAN